LLLSLLPYGILTLQTYPASLFAIDNDRLSIFQFVAKADANQTVLDILVRSNFVPTFSL